MKKLQPESNSIHILGICGTFMAGAALLAREQGYQVTGQDVNVYPPMSTQLENAGIKLISGYDTPVSVLQAENYVIGNALSRGKYQVLEDILNYKLPYISGPQWVAENILKKMKVVIAVSGTHGKTTTSSMISWILDYAGFAPGFLIGGVPENFGVSARMGNGEYFVIEADEYDSAFFDKRSKFIHYHPDILVLNNLEFDHADIFPDLAAIQKQFEYLLRTVPENGLIITNNHDQNLFAVLNKSCWTAAETFGENNGRDSANGQIGETNLAGSEFEILYQNQPQGKIKWSLIGKHNQYNALAAVSAAHAAGVKIPAALEALSQFKNVKKRLELLGKINQSKIYSDFAHHPTAIQTTLAGLRAQVGEEKIIVVLECGSNTMKMGVHRETLSPALYQADHVIFLKPTEDWGIENISRQCKSSEISQNIDEIIAKLKLFFNKKINQHIVLMTNTSFGGLSQKLFE